MLHNRVVDFWFFNEILVSMWLSVYGQSIYLVFTKHFYIALLPCKCKVCSTLKGKLRYSHYNLSKTTKKRLRKFLTFRFCLFGGS